MDIGTERRQHLRETGQLRRAGELKRWDHSAAVTGAVQCIERARSDPLAQAAREHAKTGGGIDPAWIVASRAATPARGAQSGASVRKRTPAEFSAISSFGVDDSSPEVDKAASEGSPPTERGPR